MIVVLYIAAMIIIVELGFWLFWKSMFGLGAFIDKLDSDASEKAVAAAAADTTGHANLARYYASRPYPQYHRD